jgi:hypothetical protein
VVAVILGEDFFHVVDVEFDLAHKTVRLFKPTTARALARALAPSGATDVPTSA